MPNPAVFSEVFGGKRLSLRGSHCREDARCLPLPFQAGGVPQRPLMPAPAGWYGRTARLPRAADSLNLRKSRDHLAPPASFSALPPFAHAEARQAGQKVALEGKLAAGAGKGALTACYRSTRARKYSFGRNRLAVAPSRCCVLANTMPENPHRVPEKPSSQPKEIRRRVQNLGLGLARIRRHAEEALAELEELGTILDPKSAKWQCDGCGYTKHFTKQTTMVACDQCPRCNGSAFSPI